MKMTIQVLVMLTVIAIQGCTGETVMETNRWEYHCNNSDPTQFGYQHYDFDVDVSTNSICLAGQFVFITDAYHGNVKRIDIRTGEVMSSKGLLSVTNSWPRDVVVFNSQVYVTTDLDSLFVLNMDLQLVGALRKPWRNETFLFQTVANDLLIYSRIWDSIATIDNSGRFVGVATKSRLYPYASAHGKKYKRYVKGGKHYFECDDFVLPLQDSLPHPLDKVDAINVDFDSSHLVYFDVDEKQFTLYVYYIPEENLKPRTEAADTLRREE